MKKSLFMIFIIMGIFLWMKTIAGELPNAKKVVYIDTRDVSWSNPALVVTNAVDAGYNVIILAFYMAIGPYDMAIAWQSMGSVEQIKTMSYVHAKNAVVLVSAGGAADVPYLSLTGVQYGTQVGNFVVQNYLDGVDFDMENFEPGLNYNGINQVQWLSDCTAAAKQVMVAAGLSSSIITHAPQAPYFGPWAGINGGYVAVYVAVGNLVDWFNVQFYNQGVSCYVDYNSLFLSSTNGGLCIFPGTSVNEINNYGIPMNKIVVGKYTQTGDGYSGFIDANNLSSYFFQAYTTLSWSAGVMYWAWSAINSATTLAIAWPSGIDPKSTQSPATLSPFTLVPVTQSISTNSPITTEKLISTTSAILPTIFPSSCTASDPLFVCKACDLFQCDLSSGRRVVQKCAPGTTCVNGSCQFGTCSASPQPTTTDVLPLSTINPKSTTKPASTPRKPTARPSSTFSPSTRCTPTEPQFVCRGCDLFLCDINSGFRVVQACAPGTTCVNGLCVFGTCGLIN